MNVKELIKELESCQDKEMEISYQTNIADIELLIGEDADNPKSSSIVIKNPGW